MSNNASNNDLNREYIYVRRLISMLTNDDSDKLIVEKLKGKNLTALLYNAKIIDNSKNMAANKKILACVIRAIEREKHLCRNRALEQSWARKFLKSFNCLYPGLKEEGPEQSMFGGGCTRKPSSQRVIKHRALSKRTGTSSSPAQNACKHSVKNRCQSASICSKTTTTIEKHQLKGKRGSCIDSLRNKTDSCIKSIVTGKLEDENCRRRWEVSQQQVLVSYKSQRITYETIRPPLLQQKKLNCVMVYPGRPLPPVTSVEKAEKKSSSTQTSDIQPDIELSKIKNNIRLQDLLEAASGLINTRDQKEYVKTFLTNFEPPFDLSAGFPPYLKLPMKKSDDLIGKESVYGSNSELSLGSNGSSPARQPKTTNDIKQDNVRRYVGELVSEPWQDTTESIISGVINESLPHDKADYSQLGACILKRLGAYPASSFKDIKYRRQNFNIPEIILQCTEFFESDAGDSDKKPELTTGNDRAEQTKDSKLDKSPSIVEMKLSDERDCAKPWDDIGIQNYCFLDSGRASSHKVGLLNLSESSLVDVGTCQGKSKVADQGDAPQDRKNLQLREPLKITPSGLEQGGTKPKKIFERRGDNKTAKPIESRRVPELPNLTPKLDDTETKNTGKSARLKVSIYTVTSGKNQEHSEGSKDPIDDTATIESVSILKSESKMMTTESKLDENDPNAQGPQIKMSAEITETGNPSEPTSLPLWEPSATEVETFDGVGEGQKTLSNLPEKKPDKKLITCKNRSLQEKTRNKKKCKVVSKKKLNKNGEGNCRVM